MLARSSLEKKRQEYLSYPRNEKFIKSILSNSTAEKPSDLVFFKKNLRELYEYVNKNRQIMDVRQSVPLEYFDPKKAASKNTTFFFIDFMVFQMYFLQQQLHTPQISVLQDGFKTFTKNLFFVIAIDRLLKSSPLQSILKVDPKNYKSIALFFFTQLLENFELEREETNYVINTIGNLCSPKLESDCFVKLSKFQEVYPILRYYCSLNPTQNLALRNFRFKMMLEQCTELQKEIEFIEKDIASLTAVIKFTE